MKTIKLFIKEIFTEETESNGWAETYEVKDNIDPKIYGEDLVSQFNESRRPGEPARLLVAAEEIKFISKIVIKVTIDPSDFRIPSDDEEEIEWFINDVIKKKDDLSFSSGVVGGEEIGEIKEIEILEWK